ncbi:alcohol dehydrogenase catalytic domain-containing protein [Nakamurella sp. YIM 132087]|uniref:Alcohol dehydrogenase catalytic domain-containing protein n=1 Tax=Nakamurella alba TaxID=2665158 RepID=A0A7K1FQW0_9ACTN|nr:alcohol dehydrogenase catalytic domain-containing protein [Nakamurella alba]MTD15749.1 alcohol dehydrogenase catalytic domain-containing protein [Nakamurella alba]
MRALVLTGPGKADVRDVPAPVAGPGQVVVDVHRVGVCGTDVAFLRGTMPYLATGQAVYPLRPGHEWCGAVSSVGPGVDESWTGRRVSGDTMLGCRRCDRCARGLQHVCADRFEVGVLGGWHGALAEQVLVPVTSLQPLPDSVSDGAGAMVEPGGNSARAVLRAGVAAGERVAVIGPGTLGLLAADFARAAGAEVHVLGRSAGGLDLARGLGVAGVHRVDDVPALEFQVVIDMSSGVGMPRRAFDLVEPGGRVVLAGIAGEPTAIDVRELVFKDVTMIGDLSGSPAAEFTVGAFADGTVDPEPLVAATVPLERAADVLEGWRPEDAGPGPKMHIDPRR